MMRQANLVATGFGLKKLTSVPTSPLLEDDGESRKQRIKSCVDDRHVKTQQEDDRFKE